MKALSDTLNTTLRTLGSPKGLQHGLTIQDGQTGQSRPQPLMANQLTAIASHVLHRGFEIVSEEKPKYLETSHSEDPKIVGTQTVIDVIADLNQDCSVAMLQSALMVSPREAVLKHLTHLAIHKKMGSSEADRSVLLADYVSALKDYPEYVIYEVCKHYWENDRRPFLPFIGEMKEACEIFRTAVERLLKNKTQKTIGEKSTPKNVFYKSEKDNPIRREICDFLISQGKPDYFEKDRFWSNYDLERNAMLLGWAKSSSKAEEALRNLRAG